MVTWYTDFDFRRNKPSPRNPTSQHWARAYSESCYYHVNVDMVTWHWDTIDCVCCKWSAFNHISVVGFKQKHFDPKALICLPKLGKNTSCNVPSLWMTPVIWLRQRCSLWGLNNTGLKYSLLWEFVLVTGCIKFTFLYVYDNFNGVACPTTTKKDMPKVRLTNFAFLLFGLSQVKHIACGNVSSCWLHLALSVSLVVNHLILSVYCASRVLKMMLNHLQIA